MLNIYQDLLQLIEQEQSVILGTLICKKGSAPQVPGASAIFNQKGLLKGTLGGGILEAEAERLACSHAADKHHLLRTINYTATIDDEAGAICGGEASFVLDFSPEKQVEAFFRMNSSLTHGKSGHLITLVDEQKGIRRYWQEDKETLDDDLMPYRPYVVRCHQHQTTCYTKVDNVHVLVEWLSPPQRLIIVGAGHIGQALCHMGSLLGFEVTVLDNRPEYANETMLPDARQLILGDLSDNIKKLQPTPDTYLVIVTQGHKTDYAALLACLQSDAGYIGMIGSKRKVQIIKDDLLNKNLATQAELDAIYSPIGLDIGAKTVQEIAVSIAAELVQVRHFKASVKDVAMIILAAGMSKRMNAAKMLLPFGGQTIVETVVDASLHSKVNHAVVVTGANAEQISQKINHLPVQVAFNEGYASGMLSSVQCGVRAVNGFGAFLVLPGDQPFVQSSTINRLIHAYRKSDKGLVVPVFNGKKGHPVLISSKYQEQIYQLDPNIGLRQLFHQHADDIEYLEIESDEVVIDLDNREEYNEALGRLKDK
ncbi:XdhC family protein [Carboxylicivirga mesophila]|uniref:XdhC family protein n=1 Tax=Carboxylicivirga mesophila TaxID=1166478 RepID=A0ABS5KCS8_9BACT|nr:XdhC family protein [Carboxylicivirga mesophila]MBS2212303.1 XdhC family protein [Carboxylicivirga mesophila]